MRHIAMNSAVNELRMTEENFNMEAVIPTEPNTTGKAISLNSKGVGKGKRSNDAISRNATNAGFNKTSNIRRMIPEVLTRNTEKVTMCTSLCVPNKKIKIHGYVQRKNSLCKPIQP
ncbi:hypothetical protein V6N13_118146 [Hibiscus sabdariffa]